MIIVLASKQETALKSEIEILAEIKRELRKNKIAKEICKEYGFGIDILDGIPIEFEDDLEASAKTIDSSIKLSSDLLNEDFDVIMRYAIHELVHALQHMEMVGGDPYAGDEYLDREDELEAFQYQIQYDSEVNGEDEVIEYVEDLIEYHEIPPEDRDSKKEELLEKAL